MRIALLAALAAVLAVIAAGCSLGPMGPADPEGSDADPVALLSILPSPGDLRGPAAATADADTLQVAFTGTADPQLADRIASRNPKAAGVRTWSGPGGQTLTAAVSVWDSHLLATGVGNDLATDLATTDGGEAWTPRSSPGSRGARGTGPNGRELRLAYSVGPNSVYVRATGPVPEETVVKALERLTFQLQNGQGTTTD